ncbi:MAG: nuclear transport factor 2 family protein [Gammaproteobacteria bacterium]|nr:MAG: nuclear transport factor 2 family protein [Gammaproteobacteria bacterium]
MDTMDRYIAALQDLSPDSVADLRQLLADDVEFCDPFNRVHGADSYLALLEDMFFRLENVRFSVHESLRQGQVAYLHWTFAASSRLTGQLSFPGVTRLQLQEDGRITRHEDFWDSAALYRQLPLVGSLMRWLRRRAAHSG